MGQKTVNGLRVKYSASDSNTARTITVDDAEIVGIGPELTGSNRVIHLKFGSVSLISRTASSTSAADKGANVDSFIFAAKSNPYVTINRQHNAQTVTIELSVYGESTSSTTTVPAKPSYKVTYNANGGSGAPAASTKWYGETLTLSTSKPTRTGYTFKGWGTSSSATSTVTTYTDNAAKTFYAVWQINTYTVSYANGGRGTAPSSQTKTYGTNLTLRAGLGVVSNYRFSKWKAADGTLYSGGGTYSKNAATTMTAQWIAPYAISYNGNGSTGGSTSAQTKVHDTAINLQPNGFTRTNHTFAGWNTKANGSGTAYSAGQSYTANAALTLYAQWTQVYASPTLTISKAYRADSSGTASDEGTYLAIEANYSVYSGGGNAISSWLAECNGQTGSTPASGGSDLSGSVKFVLAANLSAESSYPVTLTLTDTNGGADGLSSGTVTKTVKLGVAAYPLDMWRYEDDGSYGVAIGGLVTRKGLDVFMDAYFRSANMHLDNVGDHYFVFPNTDTSGNPTVTHWRMTFTGYGNLRLDKSTDGGSTWTLGTRYFASEDRVWPLDKGGTGATTAAAARAALGLGSFATRSSLGVAITSKDGSVKDSSARSSGANYQIDITLAAESGYMPIAVVAVSTNSGQAFLRGFDLDGISTGGTPKVKTYWRANAAMSANTVTYTAQVMLIKTTLP